MRVLLIAVFLVSSAGVEDPSPLLESAQSTLGADETFVCQSWEGLTEPVDLSALEERHSLLPSAEPEQVTDPGEPVQCNWRRCRPPFDKGCFDFVEEHCRAKHPHDPNEFQLCYCFNSIPECCGGF